MEDGSILPVLVESRAGYRNLCRLITKAKLRGTKESSPVNWEELAEFAEGLVALFTGTHLEPLREVFGRERLFVEIQRHHVRGEKRRNEELIALADRFRLPLFGDYYTPNLMTNSPENTMMGNAIDLKIFAHPLKP